eukprot:TRINITY_DN3393_c0_g1_i1.p1 TRINITY_DN3393_c0_g1~~TRINITY_DN3393_c0_g1_i1.p1  ORF type:complete len:263 (-),score=60.99 TRINITY_DN3393_c0_g1_i1:114-848(-)
MTQNGNAYYTPRNLQDISAGIQLDALSYVEEGFENDVELQRTIEGLLKEEMSKRAFVPEQYLAHLPAVPKSSFEDSVFLKEEFERMQRGEKLKPLDTSRYTIQAPKTSAKPTPTDVESWRQALGNAESQLEHQSIKTENLELLSVYGANLWKLYNTELETVKNKVQAQLSETQDKIDDVNRKRKREQLDAITEITRLDNEWYELCYKNVRIDLACQKIENEIDELSAKLPNNGNNNDDSTDMLD